MLPAGSGARRLMVRAVYETGTVVGRHEWISLPVARWRGHGVPVGPGIDVVIEGYPRSANTFAVAALASAQPGQLRIAHHVHAPANVIAGVRRGLPTLVLIDEPRTAVVQFALGKTDLTVGQALRGWVRFYRPLLPYRGRFVVATTDEVLSDFGAVIRRLNERFGRSLREFAPTEEAMERARDGMDRYLEGRVGPGLPLVGRSVGIGRNSDAERERVRRAYEAPRLAALRQSASRLHETFTTVPG